MVGLYMVTHFYRLSVGRFFTQKKPIFQGQEVPIKGSLKSLLILAVHQL